MGQLVGEGCDDRENRQLGRLSAAPRDCQSLKSPRVQIPTPSLELPGLQRFGLEGHGYSANLDAHDEQGCSLVLETGHTEDRLSAFYILCEYPDAI